MKPADRLASVLLGITAVAIALTAAGVGAGAFALLCASAAPLAVGAALCARLERPFPGRALILGGGLGVLLALLTAPVAGGFVALFVQGFGTGAHQLIRSLELDPRLTTVLGSPWVLVLLITVVAVAPLTEEAGKALGAGLAGPASREEAFLFGATRLFMSFLMAAVAVIILTSCSSTRIESTLNPAVVGAAPVRSVLVVGMWERPEVRTRFESDMVYFLAQHSVAAVGSQGRFTLDEFRGDRKQLREKLEAAKVSFVLITRETARTTFLGPPSGAGGDMSWGEADDFVSGHAALSAGDIKTDVRLGAKLYRVSDGAVLWSGLVDTLLKENYNSVAVSKRVAETIVKRMVKDKVIAPQLKGLRGGAS